jgi:GntR family transcriptional regulator/MocR family aminotransferase
MRPSPRWTLDAIDLERDGSATLVDRIAVLIIEDIRRGRLRPGAWLPGSRPLAQALGVDRETVQRAVAVLAVEGWLEVVPRRGTRVADELPTRTPRALPGRRTAVPARAGFAFDAPIELEVEVPPRDGTIDLSTGVPDVRLAPRDALARAYRAVLRRSGGARLGYADPRGEPSLRHALGAMLSETRALATDADAVLVTNGSQHGIDLFARAVLKQGDRVAVEDPGYAPAWRAFRTVGAKVVPIPVDARGLDVEALRAEVRRGLRAVYVTPAHQYPTMAVMAPERRAALLALAAEHRVAILEDDYDHELSFDGRPIAPLASADRAGVVVYVGSFSKLFAPGLRVGFVVPPRDLLPVLTALRFVHDRQGDHAREAALASLIEDGVIERHVRRVRRIYLARREALIDGLTRIFGASIAIERPPGGLALWPRFDLRPRALGRLLREALARGVSLDPGSSFTHDARFLPHLRVGFAAHDDRERERALTRLREAARRVGLAAR